MTMTINPVLTTQQLTNTQMLEIAAALTDCDLTRANHAEVAEEWLFVQETGACAEITLDLHSDLFYALDIAHPMLHELFAGYAARLEELDLVPQRFESHQDFLDFVCTDNPFSSDKPGGIVILLGDHVLAADPAANKPALESETFPTIADFCATHGVNAADILIERF